MIAWMLFGKFVFYSVTSLRILAINTEVIRFSAAFIPASSEPIYCFSIIQFVIYIHVLVGLLFFDEFIIIRMSMISYYSSDLLLFSVWMNQPLIFFLFFMMRNRKLTANKFILAANNKFEYRTQTVQRLQSFKL